MFTMSGTWCFSGYPRSAVSSVVLGLKARKVVEGWLRQLAEAGAGDGPTNGNGTKYI